jgi:GNAT superfamily N-acetyltransferase
MGLQPDLSVRQATVADLPLLVPLFDAYRQFYRSPADPQGAKRFLMQRFERNESVVFLAFDGAAVVGFTQLYPSFSSVAMAPIFILNDLFVTPEARGCGAGSALLHAAADYGRTSGAVRLVLSTEVANTTAQSVYERLGWKRDTVFYTYQFGL